MCTVPDVGASLVGALPPILSIHVSYPDCDTPPLRGRHTPPYHVRMIMQPTPMPDTHIDVDTLPPKDAAYLERIERALRCGVPGCQCADGPGVHCPCHDNPLIPTLAISYDEDTGFAFQCTRCPANKVTEALAKRGLMPFTRLYTSTGAVEAGLDPFAFHIQQPQDWLWPNRIPLAKLTLIAGYPSSGKTSVALDIAARVSRGAPAPDQPDAPFPAAPVVLASLNSNSKADLLPTLRLFGADLDFIYRADLLSPTHRLDYYPDDPPNENDEEEEDDVYDDVKSRGTPLGRPSPITGRPRMFPLFGDPEPATPKLAAPWPGLSHAMGRLANYIEAGSAALLVVDQVEDLASMHRAQVATILGMLKALAARTGAAVLALTHNPESNYPRAVTAMQRRLAHASVVFTTALVEPGGRRFLVPLRPHMSDDTPAIPFVLPPPPSFSRASAQPRSPSPGSPSPGSPSSALPPSSVIPAKAGIQGSPADNFTVAWRKPINPAHLRALAEPRPNDGAKVRAAQAFLLRALTDGSRPAVAVEREATLLDISKGTLRRARVACNVICTRVSEPGVRGGPGAWYWSLPKQTAVQQNETPDEA